MFSHILLTILLIFCLGIHADRAKLRLAPFGRQRQDKQGCYIVKVKDSGRSRRRELFNKISSNDGDLLNFTNSFVKCDCQLSEVDKLADDADVDYIEEDTVVSINYQQNTGTSYWNLDRVDQSVLPCDGLFNYQYTGQGVPIYILDTGVNAAHEEFTGRIGQGKDIIGRGDASADCNGHGTHAAGIAAGTRSGVAKRATVVPVRVLACDGSGTMSGIIAGINWVMSQKPGVISISLGGPASTSANDAVAAATNNGFVVVSAAGNDNSDACTKSPASAPSAITVAATSNTDQRSSYSNYGSCVDIFAPGDNIWSASNTNNTGYLLKSGTSMATPLVAGAVAAYWSSNPSARAQQIATMLLNEATSGVVQGTMGSPNLLLKTSATPNFHSRSPSRSPVSASSSPSPWSPSPSPTAPANDLCPNAIELPCNSVVSGSTVMATFNGSPGVCGTTHTAPEVWYYINVPAGQITLSMCKDANFDTKLTLWGGSCSRGNSSPLQCITGADDTSGCGVTTALTRTVTAGRYIVMVHGYRSSKGSFKLSLTCPNALAHANEYVESPASSPELSPSIVPNPVDDVSAGASPSESPSSSADPSSSESPPSSEIPIFSKRPPTSESPSSSSESSLFPVLSPVGNDSAPESPPTNQPSPSANPIPISSQEASDSPSWSPLESSQPSASQSSSPSPKRGRIRGFWRDRSTSDSMYDEGITEWGYSIGTLGQITSQSAARLAALADTIEETQMVSYKEGFHAQIVTEDDPHFVLSTTSGIGLTVSVSDWGPGVAKAVVTSFNIMDVNLRQLGLTQDSSDPYVFLCQVDRITAKGELANNQLLVLTLKLPQNVPFKVSLHTLDQRSGVSLASAGGYVTPTALDNVFNIYVPHTSMIAIRAPLQVVDSAPDNNSAMLGLLGLFALIPLAGVTFCLVRFFRRRAAAHITDSLEKNVPLPLWTEAPMVICHSPGSSAPASSPHSYSEMRSPSNEQLLSPIYDDVFSPGVSPRNMAILQGETRAS